MREGVVWFCPMSVNASIFIFQIGGRQKYVNYFLKIFLCCGFFFFAYVRTSVSNCFPSSNYSPFFVQGVPYQNILYHLLIYLQKVIEYF